MERTVLINIENQDTRRSRSRVDRREYDMIEVKKKKIQIKQ